jgi:hypothetical protein
MELCLHDAEFSSFDPSYMAACSLCLSFKLLSGADWVSPVPSRTSRAFWLFFQRCLFGSERHSRALQHLQVPNPFDWNPKNLQAYNKIPGIRLQIQSKSRFALTLL